MKIETLFFGITRDISGTGNRTFEFEAPVTVDALREMLKAAYPGLVDIKNFAIAVNESYVKGDHLLKNNDVVAIIPPVSGG